MPNESKALQRLRRFPTAREGSFALWLAASLLPLSLLVGAGVDLGRQATARTFVQDAGDAAALAAGKAYLTSTARDPAQRLAEARAAADAVMRAGLAQNRGTVLGLNWDLAVDPATREVTLTAAGRSPNAFGGLFGLDSLGVTTSSTVSGGLRRMEVALVLDNTGSMSGRKLALLKQASAGFVDKLDAVARQSADPEAVKFALAPFSMTVNVGSQYASAPWIDRNARSPIHDENFSRPANRFTLLNQLGETWDGCVETRPYPHDVRDTAPSSGNGASLYVPFFAPDEPDAPEFGNSYLTDLNPGAPAQARQEDVAKYDVASTGGKVKRGQGGAYRYGPNSGCELAPVLRLTQDAGRMRSALHGMRAIGDTNIPIGLAWGWNMIAPDGPFGDGAPYDRRDTMKVVVLMTDGQNNITPVSGFNGSYYSGVGYPSKQRLGVGAASSRAQRQAALDARLAELCRNMKAKGVVIYTLRVEVNEGSSDVLRDCASEPGYFTDVQNAAEMEGAFDRIAQSIVALRLSR